MGDLRAMNERIRAVVLGLFVVVVSRPRPRVLAPARRASSAGSGVPGRGQEEGRRRDAQALGSRSRSRSSPSSRGSPTMRRHPRRRHPHGLGRGRRHAAARSWTPPTQSTPGQARRHQEGRPDDRGPLATATRSCIDVKDDWDKTVHIRLPRVARRESSPDDRDVDPDVILQRLDELGPGDVVTIHDGDDEVTITAEPRRTGLRISWTRSGGPPTRLSSPGVANRLAAESSPYLLQHTDNPVDWYPWGTEAFARAKRGGQADLPLDRLLDLPLVPRHGARVLRDRARSRRLLNRDFVSIKVDREERPDVDDIYMTGRPDDDRRAAAGRCRSS